MKVKDFILDKNLCGDSRYISNGELLLAKDTLKKSGHPYASLLSKIKTHDDFKLNYVPYDEGEYVFFPQELTISSNDKLYFEINNHTFDYDYLNLAEDLLEDVDQLSVVEGIKTEEEGYPSILKLWESDNNFIGCIASCRVNRKYSNY